jgi:hypothetical protein
LLAKMEAHLGELPRAVNSAREALIALTISHGPRAGVVTEMARVLGESEAELRHIGNSGGGGGSGGGGTLGGKSGGVGKGPSTNKVIAAAGASARVFKPAVVGTGTSNGNGNGGGVDKWSDGLWNSLIAAADKDDEEDDVSLAPATGGQGLWGPDSYDRVIIDDEDMGSHSSVDDDYNPDTLD